MSSLDRIYMISVKSILYLCIRTMRMQLCNMYSDQHVCIQQYNQTSCITSSTQKNPSAFCMQLGTGMQSMRVIRTQKHTVGYVNMFYNHVRFITGLRNITSVLNGHTSTSKQQRSRPLLEDNGRNVSKRIQVKNSRDEISNYSLHDLIFILSKQHSIP